MECLIDEACDEYTELAAGEKREFVRTQICQRIRNTGRALLVFRGTHPTKGILEEAPEDEILDRLAQKLRDLKKRRLRGDAPTYKRRKLERPSMPESHSDGTYQ